MMSGNQYKAKQGWTLTVPAGFSAYPLDCAESCVEFVHDEDPRVVFSWAVIPGKPISRFTDCRFKILLEEEKPSLRQAANIMRSILPPLGLVTEAFCISLPDGSRALEFTAQAGTGRSCCMIALPFDPQMIMTHPESASLRQWFPDPITGEPVLYSPEVLHRAVANDGSTVEWFGLGHDRYQRLMFLAPTESFSKWIAAVKQSMRGFHYLSKPANPWQTTATWPSYESWFMERFAEMGDPFSILR